jgi:hypothetical protein
VVNSQLTLYWCALCNLTVHLEPYECISLNYFSIFIMWNEALIKLNFLSAPQNF